MGNGGLTKKTISEVSKKVYASHREFDNVTPKMTKSSNGLYSFTYEKKTQTGDGQSLKMILKAIVDEDGNIKNVSVSR